MAEKLSKEDVIEEIEIEFDYIQDSSRLTGSFVNHKIEKLKKQIRSL